MPRKAYAIRMLLAALTIVPLSAFGSGNPRLDQAAAAARALVDEAAANGIRASAGLVDVSGAGAGTRIVGSRDGHHSASTIKLALLATVMRRADRGPLNLDAPTSISPYMVVGGAGDLQKQDMRFTTTMRDVTRRMMALSGNTATNVLLYHAGLPTVQALLDDSNLRNGLNVHAGKLTCRAVADALGLPFTPASEALAQ